MKAVSSDVVPTDEGWEFEIKWDGIRAIAFVDDGKVRLQSSNRRRCHAWSPAWARISFRS